MGWLDDVIAVYGKPRLRSNEPVRMRDDEGIHEKSYWVWFPANKNHHISIKRYVRESNNGHWVVDIGSHLPDMPSVCWRSRTEPDDELMDSLLDATGFLTTPVNAAVT
jgi:hypothetical protein